MIENYKDFLLESKISQMINEGELTCSSGFLEKLKFMSKNNKLAEILYTLFDDNQYFSTNLAQNWIDTTTTDDTISFLSDVKADKLGYDLNKFEVKGRTTVKIGRFVNAFLNNTHVKEILKDDFDEIKFNDKAVEEFVNLYKSINLDADKKFKVVKGEKIAFYYNEDNYASTSGQLGSSCMRNVDDDYFDIYVNNEKVCKLLIYTDKEGQLLGRALVWKLQKAIGGAQYFMDRVYTSNDSDIIKFKSYADEKGWLIKNRNNSDAEEALLFRYRGEPVFGRIFVKLDDADFDDYPYVDTLSFLDKDGKLLSNVGFKDGKVLSSTDGDAETCDDCDGDGVEECDNCNGDGTVTCDNCDGDGMVECEECGGTGLTENELKCKHCKGEGEVECEDCKGEGEVECEDCSEASGCPSCVGLEKEVISKIKSNYGEVWKDYKSLI